MKIQVRSIVIVSFLFFAIATGREAPATRMSDSELISEANFFEVGLLAVQRSHSGRSISGEARFGADPNLAALGREGLRDMRTICARGDKGSSRRASKVTRYYVPLLKSFKKGPCHKMEGVCRYWKNGVEYIANYGKPTVRYDRAFCKNGVGYGLDINCTHPCRSLAASTSHHKGGEIIFFPGLVGKKCGTGQNRMIHDGFMVVNDTGHPKHFNHEGRFDFFWGECRRFKNGSCLDPDSVSISQALSKSTYCRVWRPQDPGHNVHIKVALTNAVRSEAIARGDVQAAAAFDLNSWAAPSHAEAGRRLASRMRQQSKLASMHNRP